MKKLSIFLLLFTFTIVIFNFDILSVSAGGYCPTWVKTSENTAEAAVYNPGDIFEASTFEITAGNKSDVNIEKLRIR